MGARAQQNEDELEQEELETENEDEQEDDDDQGSESDADESDDEQDEDEDDDDDEDGFQGKFDPKRAKRTINRLRRENKNLKRGGKRGDDVAALRTENLQLKVAGKLGIPQGLASRLRGKTEDEMVEDASELLDELGLGGDDEEEKPRTRQPKPKPKPRGGSNPSRPQERSADDIVDAALKY